jgi:hypothetical protein
MWAIDSEAHQAGTQAAALGASVARASDLPFARSKHATPLAAFVARCGSIDSRTIALRALLAGYEPTLAGRDVTKLTTSDVIATVRKAIDAIRKAQVGK